MSYCNYKLILNTIILSGMTFINIQANDSHSDIVTLSSPVLHLIDGIPGLMDEHTIHKTLHMGRELSKLQFGNVEQNTKKRLPQYEYMNKLYTLHEIAKIETEFVQKNEHLKNSDPAKYQKMIEPFTILLQKIKNDFEAITNPFLHEARGTRQQMIQLISESCQKRNRLDSLLLNWSEGTENESFRKDVTSLAKLDQFCSDLTNFLKDIVNSCPRALDKFRKRNRLNS